MTIRPVADPHRPDPDLIDAAVQALEAGDLVVIPTETVYGLAADARVAGAVEKIHRAKHRPAGKEIAFLLETTAWRSIPSIAGHPLARRLAERFWPGPLTLVVPQSDGWTGFRVPDHPVTQALLRAFHDPLAVTSANRSGHSPALTAAEAACDLAPHVALILDAGPSPGGIASTVVRVLDDTIEILREGALTNAEIAQATTHPP